MVCRFNEYTFDGCIMLWTNLVRDDIGKTMMKMIKVKIARIYVMESSHLLETILDYVQNEVKLRGLSVFRAISGFGESGEKSASFMALSMDLPLCIEFFDSPSRIDTAVIHLSTIVKPKHIVVWDAEVVD